MQNVKGFNTVTAAGRVFPSCICKKRKNSKKVKNIVDRFLQDVIL